MALTDSNMLPLQTRAPEFALSDVVTQKNITFADVAGKSGTVVMFICNHCPFVKFVLDEIINLSNTYLKKGIGFVAISANDINDYSEDAPDKMAELALRSKFAFPYLYDETQETAKAYHAACTPDFYLFDEANLCVYRGQLDNARPGNGKPVTGKDLREALDALLAHKPISADQKPSQGCNIKWKK